MELFTSWSGGKDCMLALYRILQKNQYDVNYLVNMYNGESQRSHSHGINGEWIVKQAESLRIPLIQKNTTTGNYEKNFKQVLAEIKAKGVEGGIFGDIYLQGHRDWIERVCKEMELTPFFPLWQEDTLKLINEFVDEGFRSVVVSTRKDMLDKKWLGRQLNKEFIYDIRQHEGLDPCAENGEYHTYVFDGPIFNYPVNFKNGSIYKDTKHWFLELEMQ